MMRAIDTDRLSELELAILRKAAQRCNSDRIARQVEMVSLKDRVFTGVGVYVNLTLAAYNPIDAAPDLKKPIDGLLFESDSLCMGSADSIVWTNDDGYLDCIEIFGNGDGEYPQIDFEATSPEL